MSRVEEVEFAALVLCCVLRALRVWSSWGASLGKVNLVIKSGYLVVLGAAGKHSPSVQLAMACLQLIYRTTLE